MDSALNVLGGPLEPCSMDPLTGFFRDGCCNTDGRDTGLHIVCAQMTAEFLSHQKNAGNDLSTPRPEFGFAGLKPGDRWCVCLSRWKQALDAGAAAPIILAATHEEALAAIPIDVLRANAIDAEAGDASD
ncbi:MAG: DUF2237 domain-containing protein [Pseudomonadota bacterium]